MVMGIEELEVQRKHLAKTFKTYIVISSIIGAICILISIIFHLVEMIFILSVYFFIVVVILAVTVLKKWKILKGQIKKGYVCDLMTALFINPQYEPLNSINRDVVKEAGFVQMGNTYSGDDLMRGEYNGVKFTASDLLIQNVTSNGKQTITVTYFQGKYMIFSFNKPFDANFCICSKAGIRKIAIQAGLFTHRKKVELEDESFNMEFSCQTTDEHTFFYIVTPNFSEKVRELKKAFDYGIALGFTNNEVHVLICTKKNSMEPSLFAEINESFREVCRKEMDTIIKVIDVLDLSNKMFL